MRWCRPLLAASAGLTVLGVALWVLVAVEVFADTDLVAPRHECCLTITAATVIVVAAIGWSTLARMRAECERTVLIKTLADAVRPRRETGPQTRPPLRSVRPR